jgi:sarcosine oxidase subunit alpha
MLKSAREKVNLTVDGRRTQASLYEPVLGVARRLGIEIPTLCHHDALEPLGACRLCLVEVKKNGRSKIATACNYPAEDGIEIFTSTPAVLQHRRVVVEMLLARCPEVPAIQKLAGGLGIETSRLGQGDDTCILCGLCTRVCETYATSAIAMLNRGERKEIGTFAGDAPTDCVGCDACASICPTGHITSKRETGRLSIWGRDFPLAVCTVNKGRCVACGVCEEACPFSIPRVILRKDGSSAAFIDVNACRGCGVCLAACPCGAIEQPRAKRDLPSIEEPLEKGRALVIACPRSNLEKTYTSGPSDGIDVMELPCSGGVSPAMLLGALARGYAAVLVLGRHEGTCRLKGAERHARLVVERVEKLARLVGLGPDRAVFADPAPGQGGPVLEIDRFRRALKPTLLAEAVDKDAPAKMPGDAASILCWLVERKELSPNRDLDLIRDYLAEAIPFKPTYKTEKAANYSSLRVSRPTAGIARQMPGARRIYSHPILELKPAQTVEFTFNGKQLLARKGEMIASALFASGISVFGHHHRDGGAQGIFCANGQCSQCNVIADGRMVKSCMVQVMPGMVVKSMEGLAPLPADDVPPKLGRPSEVSAPVLILGGGPAGLCAAIELGNVGIEVLVIDDKPELGGKLTLQTHGFFGSVADCYAGTRGIDIGRNLAAEVEALPSVKVWTNSTALGLFWDGKVGVSTPDGYKLVAPDSLLVAMGAREKALSFPGCDLPGIYGAGAFQTLVNRDLVSASEKLFVLGGGNVGLIGAYHALQAGIDVVGLVEALPECGGYKVHADKIKRLGVPVWTSHTVVKASGKEHLESVTIARVDDKFQPVPGTEQTFEVDTLLIAVGLASVDELLKKAREYGLKVWTAGDSDEVAEASAAIFSGRITGRRIARELGVAVDIPDHWEALAKVLRSRPGKTFPWAEPEENHSVYPVIRCVQKIPCDPCVAACKEGLIKMDGGIMGLPRYVGNCLGCGGCVVLCPGLAINLVSEDYDPKRERALLVLPFEFESKKISLNTEVRTVDFDGNEVGKGRVVAIRERADQNRRRLLMVDVPFADRLKVAGFSIRGPSTPVETELPEEDEDPIVCRCERVKKSEIVREIRAGVRDLNQLKAVARPSMGGCGGKTCTELIQRIFREEGVPLDKVTPGTIRPLIAETPLGAFARSETADD